MTLPPFREPDSSEPFVEPFERLAGVTDTLSGQGWAVVPDFLDATVAGGLREEAVAREAAGRFRPAAIGRASGVALEPEIRSDRVSWIEPDRIEPVRIERDGRVGAVNAYLLAMEGLRQAMNRCLYLGLFHLEAHFASYPPGAAYTRHVDRFRDSNERILSSVFYLNADWRPGNGGQLRLYLPGDDRDGGETIQDVLPSSGTLVVFLSDRIPHEVLPADRERLSIAGWFRGRPGTPLR